MVKKIQIIIGTLTVLGAGAWVAYAACSGNATPSSQGNDYVYACDCPEVTKFTTDEGGNSAASLATCKGCTPVTGGCNSTAEHYDTVWTWGCNSGVKRESPGPHCDPQTQFCGFTAAGSQNNAAKYEYLSTGCP